MDLPWYDGRSEKSMRAANLYYRGPSSMSPRGRAANLMVVSLGDAGIPTEAWTATYRVRHFFLREARVFKKMSHEEPPCTQIRDLGIPVGMSFREFSDKIPTCPEISMKIGPQISRHARGLVVTFFACLCGHGHLSPIIQTRGACKSFRGCRL